MEVHKNSHLTLPSNNRCIYQKNTAFIQGSQWSQGKNFEQHGNVQREVRQRFYIGKRARLWNYLINHTSTQ